MSYADPAPRQPLLWLRRLALAVLVLASTALGVATMFRILYDGGLGILQAAVLGLFAITFGWIALAFWTALIGFVISLARRDPLTLARQAPPATAALASRTALVMPIYNEDPARALGGLEATCHDLLASTDQDLHDRVEAFVLSDTRDDAIAADERRHVAALRQRLAGRLALHYRRRADNAGRKAGNLAEFCRRWGRRYDYLVVLDADSVMGGPGLLQMISTMQREPELGLLQTVPIPIRQHTLFGRFTQFAAALYSPMLAAGQAFWQGDCANYWGHNAILRTRAFMAHCGLPRLSGRPPLGGEILSHDFVEAALLRRDGWRVRLDVGIQASFEELPGNLLDYARRDRRWTQGNLQHLRLLFASGLHPISRLHFAMGALAYLSSLLWVLMLGLSSADAMLNALSRERFFSDTYQLFPDWPLDTSAMVMPLLALTAAMLLLPKLFGLLLALWQNPAAFGGRWRLSASALLEMLHAILIAPLMMAFHSAFVIGILVGSSVGWDPQTREGRPVAWRQALAHTRAATLLGGAWALAMYQFTPSFFWWLTPVWAGLISAPLLVRLSGSQRLGNGLARAGLLAVPSDVQPAAVLTRLDAPLSLPTPAEAAGVPPEQPGDMPLQHLGWRRQRPARHRPPLKEPH
ncbi:glucans biosynthesis glucosyltransferase MdoH [Franzmannia qiaohouensis]|uniref:Glucans biosynthesis glucosyltransferase H n=1 Tax=Franzmannia qiaohouensis TaxID=1329370 RepID=A0ABU1HHG6_9GAMM|nr:glucans biosynthesis glucosyltransferase MdoH [Halomonas qiaohouensis]MDR5906925.1 glucans biosynthesis glucosyltransferase MdoH [Halomonas qiaohouensis]